MKRAAQLRWSAALLAVLASLAGSLVLASQSSPTSEGYADSRECASCHASIAETYARTGMARSFRRMKEPVGDVRYFHEASGTLYAMEQRGNETYQRRWRVGPDGKETEANESRIDYVMGSGNHVRTFLHRTERGALVELPLAWYAEKGGTWAMNPGHDLAYGLPPRSVAYECMFCHNAYPNIPGGHDEPGSEPLYAGALPEGIDCQRCHGPGENHIRAARAGKSAREIQGAILNPARLDRDRQMEVCMQCHLETTSLQLPHSIAKYGRGPFSYSPAEPLGSFELFYDHAPGSRYADDFEIAHSAYRLRKSKCFVQTRMTCLTCHDPHDVPRAEAASLHYNGVCGGCHKTLSAKHPPNASDCVSCHMPKRHTEDVIHAVMTDHYIQRRPPPDAVLTERHESPDREYRGPVVRYYPPAGRDHDALYDAVAQVTQKSNLRAGLPALAAQMTARPPAQPEFYLELGQAWLNVRKPANAVRAFAEAARREPGCPVAALNLADALTEAGEPARAVAILTRALKTSPGDALLWFQLGVSHRAAGNDAQALAAFRKAADVDPDMPEARNLSGELLAGAGEFAQAQQAFREALRIYPDYAEAQGNLGHLLAIQGDLAGARDHLARSVKLKPDEAEVRVNYAVTLAGLGDFNAAREQAERAVKIDPKSPEAHNSLGMVLAREGRVEAALAEFHEALRLRPDYEAARRNAAAVGHQPR